MKALVTGASSGIGKDIALYLSTKGYDLVLVARGKEELEKLQKKIKTKSEIEVMDLSNHDNCFKLFNKYKDIDTLINSAGFGTFGDFTETDLTKELNMIDLNVKTVHILMKLYLQEFVKKDSGYILNVASAAAFAPGPLMATYYATKSYVLRLTESVNEELRKQNSNVHISALCPGPVETNFNKVANVNFSAKALTSKYVAKYAIDKMFKNKLIIIPGFSIKLARIAGKILPDPFLSKFTYNIQKKKGH